ncbi:hypothetical protein [Leptothrix ochracea]|uniref:hypothetical protein n=1 Tax=Leptothrix ochracea TaxID=735331 RepID=UPI0034E2D10E
MSFMIARPLLKRVFWDAMTVIARPLMGFLGMLLCALPVAALADEQVLKRLDSTGRELAKRPCITPLSTGVKRLLNQHVPSVQDVIVTLRCHGLVSETYHAYSYKPVAVLPLTLPISAPHQSLPKELQVGASFAGVMRMLGQPMFRQGSVITYSLSFESPGEDTISFADKSGRIAAITWAWAVD